MMSRSGQRRDGEVCEASHGGECRPSSRVARYAGGPVFRVSFRLSDGPGHAREWGLELRRAAPSGVMIVAAFLDAKTFDAFIEIDHDTDPRSVADLLAARLGVNEYEVTEVEPAATPTTELPRS